MKYKDFKKTIKGVNYVIRLSKFNKMWFQTWTPKWHNGRGRYITMGFYYIAFYRGF